MNTKILQRFGERLKELREQNGLTQEKIAEKVNIHPTYVGKLESGKCNPSLMLVYKFTKILKVNLYTFFEFEKGRK